MKFLPADEFIKKCFRREVKRMLNECAPKQLELFNKIFPVKISDMENEMLRNAYNICYRTIIAQEEREYNAFLPNPEKWMRDNLHSLLPESHYAFKDFPYIFPKDALDVNGFTRFENLDTGECRTLQMEDYMRALSSLCRNARLGRVKGIKNAYDLVQVKNWNPYVIAEFWEIAFFPHEIPAFVQSD